MLSAFKYGQRSVTVTRWKLILDLLDQLKAIEPETWLDFRGSEQHELSFVFEQTSQFDSQPIDLKRPDYDIIKALSITFPFDVVL